LLLSAALVGIAFNTKMLQAYLVLPAFYVVYGLARAVSWRRRLAQLAAFTAVLLVVSFSWALTVQLTPAHLRPYVGGTTDNSEFSLAFGWNGVDRLLGGRQLTTDRGTPPEAPALELAPGIGDPSPLRLFNRLLGGQIAWLLPLALIGLCVAEPGRWIRPRTQAQQAVLLWGLWLCTGIGYFSVGGRFFAYYLVVLAPAIAAGVGIGLVALLRAHRAGSRLGWLLPLLLLLTALCQIHILADFPAWSRWLTLLILATALIAVVLLVAAQLRHHSRLLARAVLAGCALCGTALLVGPLAWSVIPVGNGGTVYAVAGPDSHHGDWFAPVRASDAAAFLAARTVVQALPNDHDPFFTGGIWPESAAPLILLTGRPALAFGGFEGTDPILTTAQLAALTSAGTVHEFLIGRETTQLDLIGWIVSHCRRGRLTGLGLLYAC
jgi:4-amino-4-deoxy-L-arabinose transferase-like glycosyltransferase